MNNQEYKKLPQQINNIVGDNLKALAQLFPSAVKDGLLDIEALKEELGQFEEVDAEKYELTWSGKQNAKKIAQEDTYNRTLKYIPEDSKNADTTENLYIEGDNLEVLKLLRQNYYGSIKMIYIDPPYNTGKDFVYNDKFDIEKNKSNVAEGTSIEIEDGVYERLQENKKSTNRYHANWLNMLYPRLKISKELLTDDGIIVISIDDNEVDNLKKICDEIIGSNNFIAQLVWEKKKKGSFLSNSITNIKEYLVVYCKNKQNFNGLIGELNSAIETYPCINAQNKREIITIPAGIESKFKEKNYFLEKGSKISDTTMSIVLHSDMIIKDGVLAEEMKIEGNWRYSQEAMYEYAVKKEIYITRDLYLRRIVSDTRYKTLKDLLPRVGEDESISYADTANLNNLFQSGWGSNEDADEELRLLMGTQKLLDYPKPVRLLLKLIAANRTFNNCTILDFFSGSATTAHAVMQLNAEDGGNRKFILVQLPEIKDENTEAYKAGYKNVCEIGKERIRRAGEKIKAEIETSNSQIKLGEEEKQVPDIGFKVFRTADTNIKWNKDEANGQVDFEALDFTPDLMDFVLGTKDIDVVYEVMLRQHNESLSDKIEVLTDIGDRTYLYATSYLVCLETVITEQLIEKLAALVPLPIKFVFRDSAFADDIDFKEYTFRRLKALVERNNGEKKQTYTVEFI